VEFMAALLSSDIPGRNFKRKDSLVEHLEDCTRMGVEVLPPDVNASQAEFGVQHGKIRFALAAIKGVGQAAEAIAADRARRGPYRSLFDLCERLDSTTLNRTAIESLVKAGALDSLGGRRAQWAAVIDRAFQSGASAAADRRTGQRGLFDSLDDEPPPGQADRDLPDLPEWDPRDRAAKEKEVLGFYLSSHPLREHSATLQTYCSHTTAEAATLRDRTEVLLGGMLSAITFKHTKNSRPGAPTRFAMFDLEDMAGTIRCILWPDLFVQHGHLVQPDTVLGVLGNVDKRPGSDEANLIVTDLIPLEDLAKRFTRSVTLRLFEEKHGQRGLEQLYEILRGYPGSCSVQLVICLADGRRVSCNCSGLRVEITSQLRSRVDELLGPGHLVLVPAARNGPAPRPGNGRSRS